MNRVITARTDPQTARSYWTMSRTDSDRAFRAARRHSRLVRVLRVTLPVVVAGTLVLMVLITWFNPLRVLDKLPVNMDILVVSGTQITMEKPRLSGFTHDARPYELSAEAAKQDLTKPDLVELHNLRAKVHMQDQTVTLMTAKTGFYNAKTETLKLEKDIVVSNNTYEGQFSEATVDINKGNVLSEKPVTLKFLQGQLDANRLEILDSGDLVRFSNGVTLDLNHLGDQAPQTATGGAAKP